MRLLSLLARAVIILTTAALTACSSSDSTDNTGSYSKRIHILAAPSGQFVKTSGETGTTGTLTLSSAYPNALWYSDRPEREAGEVSLKNFLGGGWQNAYQQTDPNATLQFTPAEGGSLAGLYISLSSPTYDDTTNQVTFQARVLDSTLEKTIPSTLTFTNATLNILNNAEDDKEVSSYVQYAARANLQPGTTANEYVLVMNQAGPDMFWVDNAPGKYSDSRPMTEFFTQWPYVFGNAPPNAALIGTTATGQLKVYFLTLFNPIHDPATQELRYSTTLLGTNHGATESLNQAVLLIDSGNFSRFPVPGKGTGYQAFSQGYDPSTANSTYIYFGSDIARKQTGSLWGTQSYLSESCTPYCRDDLKTMKDMGINLIRLYDWDPRNDHSQFLDYANSLGIKVVVPISNWLPTQSTDIWAQQLPAYFKHGNFGNTDGSDWHPAIAGVIISNELDQENGGQFYSNAIGLVAQFIAMADSLKFSKGVPVGVPVTFSVDPPIAGTTQTMPAWKAFDAFVNDSRLAAYKDRLMLCPNTYNQSDYLFVNAQGTGNGWVQQTWARYNVPILFTEIGFTRADVNYTPSIVLNQLQGSVDYQKSHPEQLLGAMHFQFSNKVWKQTPNDSDSEGAFGSFSHGAILKQIQTTASDYDYYVDGAYGVLTIDKLETTSTYAPVVQAYK